MTESKQFNQIGSIHYTTLHLHADGIPYAEYALRANVKSGTIPATMCGRKALLLYENVLRFLREGNNQPDRPVEVGKIRPIRA